MVAMVMLAKCFNPSKELTAVLTKSSGHIKCHCRASFNPSKELTAVLAEIRYRYFDYLYGTFQSL